MRVTILDYGAGNIHSLAKGLVRAGASVTVEPDPARASEAEFLVLPGVGAFEPAARHLAPARDRLRDAIAGGLPTLGICLGMQLLFESSDEGAGDGLGIIRGRVTRLAAERTPQIGWNRLEKSADAAARRAGLESAYYANAYACRPRDLGVVKAWSRHEDDQFPAIVRRGSAVGVQFHPEKSSAPGIAFIQSVLEEARR